MVFRQSTRYAREFTAMIEYYFSADPDLAHRIFHLLQKMETHLATFPEAAPFTSEQPIRKFILHGFPIRIRYVHTGSEVLLLTMEHMKQNKPL